MTARSSNRWATDSDDEWACRMPLNGVRIGWARSDGFDRNNAGGEVAADQRRRDLDRPGVHRLAALTGCAQAHLDKLAHFLFEACLAEALGVGPTGLRGDAGTVDLECLDGRHQRRHALLRVEHPGWL